MNQDFRGNIQGLADKGIDILNDYFDGTRQNNDMVKEAIKMVQFGVKIEHMNQLKDQGDKSLALRLLKFLPNDEVRERYIEITNPEVKPLLLSRPKKK